MQKICLVIVMLVMCFSLFAETEVSGAVSGVWEQANSPYVVTGNIVVNSGDTLLVEAGVNVHFTDAYTMIVHGKIRCEGTVADTIVFTTADTPEWGGMILNDNDGSHFTYCKFENGRARGDYPDNRGGALRVDDGNVQIVHSLFYNNEATNGAAICVRNNANAVIDSCRFVENYATVAGGGVYVRNSSSCQVKNSVFVDNFTDYRGGGLAVYGCSPTLDNNEFYGNLSNYFGGAIQVEGSGANPSVKNSLFRDNFSFYGGAIALMSGGRSQMEFNEFSRNTAVIYGGGVYASQSTGNNIKRCTFAYNRGDVAGGAVVALKEGYNASNVQVRDCILWGNTGMVGKQAANISSTLAVYYSTVEGGNTGFYGSVSFGTGGITGDPLFADADNNNFYLTEGSPCIDSGDPNSATDPDGSRADMGCYPFVAEDIYMPGESIAAVSSKMQVIHGNYPNPFNPETTIAFQIPQSSQVTMKIYNIKGEKVRTLMSDKACAAGNHTLQWNGMNDAGASCASGIYFYRLQVDGDSFVKKIAMLK